MNICFKKLSPYAKEPTKATDGSVGYDLYVSRLTSIRQRCSALVPSGIAFEMPEGYYATVHLRSSMSKRGIVGSTGIIDNDYTGEVFVMASNLNNTIVTINPGERIGQIIFHKYEPAQLEEVDRELKKTDRGSGGFGSTGK